MTLIAPCVSPSCSSSLGCGYVNLTFKVNWGLTQSQMDHSVMTVLEWHHGFNCFKMAHEATRSLSYLRSNGILSVTCWLILVGWGVWGFVLLTPPVFPLDLRSGISVLTQRCCLPGGPFGGAPEPGTALKQRIVNWCLATSTWQFHSIATLWSSGHCDCCVLQPHANISNSSHRAHSTTKSSSCMDGIPHQW